MLEVLRKPTLTLFCKKALSILAQKIFPEIKSTNVHFVPKAVIQNYVMYGLVVGTFAQYVEVDPSLHEETP